MVAWYLKDCEKALEKAIKIPSSFNRMELYKIGKKGYPGIEDDAEQLLQQLKWE